MLPQNIHIFPLSRIFRSTSIVVPKMRQYAKVYIQSAETPMGRKKHIKELKAQIALNVIKGQKTIAELTSEYGLHANQVSIWKKQFLDAAPAAFSNGKDKDTGKKEIECDSLDQ